MMSRERPDWLTISPPSGAKLKQMKQLLDKDALHTVCESADCPNVGECFAEHTCTFMILGNICTRNCRFCAVQHGRPEPINFDEPMAIAMTAKQLGLKHVVVTTVTRDDIPDGGAGQFVSTIRAIRQMVRRATIEVLISDLKGSVESLTEIMLAGPDIIGHNLETMPRLYGYVRPQASYSRSLDILEQVSHRGKGIFVKSGIMLGLGETFDEIVEVLRDLREVGCQIVTMGQYLSPSPEHASIDRYVSPQEFKKLEQIALDMEFLSVSAGPLVRSSYNAARILKTVTEKITRKG